MDSNWQTWLNDNLKAGCNPAEVCNIMLSNNFSPADILQNIENHCLFKAYPVVGEARKSIPMMTPGVDPTFYQQLASVKMTKNTTSRYPDDRLQLYVLQDFLTPQECDQLIERINPILYPSTITISNGDDKFRTSRTSDLSGKDDPFIQFIDQKIADALGLDLSYSEPMQAQRYDVGNEFKAHTDYFDPGTEEFRLFAEQQGQRSWTFMIYLNETEKGGATRFVNLDKTFFPKKGQAVIWNNLYPDGRVNYDSIHHGMPVEAGEKIIITKWFRDKPTRHNWL